MVRFSRISAMLASTAIVAAAMFVGAPTAVAAPTFPSSASWGYGSGYGAQANGVGWYGDYVDAGDGSVIGYCVSPGGALPVSEFGAPSYQKVSAPAPYTNGGTTGQVGTLMWLAEMDQGGAFGYSGQELNAGIAEWMQQWYGGQPYALAEPGYPWNPVAAFAQAYPAPWKVQMTLGTEPSGGWVKGTKYTGTVKIVAANGALIPANSSAGSLGVVSFYGSGVSASPSLWSSFPSGTQSFTWAPTTGSFSLGVAAHSIATANNVAYYPDLYGNVGPNSGGYQDILVAQTGTSNEALSGTSSTPTPPTAPTLTAQVHQDESGKWVTITGAASPGDPTQAAFDISNDETQPVTVNWTLAGPIEEPAPSSGNPADACPNKPSDWIDTPRLTGNDVSVANDGRRLTAGQEIAAPDGYWLVMQSDGNLVYYTKAGKALWASGTSGTGNYAILQGDGNFVVYSSSGTPLWNSGTGGHAGDQLQIGNVNSVSIISQTGTMLWSSNGYPADLGEIAPVASGSAKVLGAGQSVYSPDGYQLTLTTGGNLELVAPLGNVVWSTGTSGSGNWVAFANGNLIVYSSAGTALWASNSGNNPGAQLYVGDNGVLGVITTANKLAWSSNGRYPGGPFQVSIAWDGWAWTGDGWSTPTPPSGEVYCYSYGATATNPTGSASVPLGSTSTTFAVEHTAPNNPHNSAPQYPT